MSFVPKVDAVWARKLPWFHNQIGFLRYRQKDLEGALEGFEAARDAYRDLVKTDPTRANLRVRLAEVVRWIGNIQLFRGEPAALFWRCQPFYGNNGYRSLCSLRGRCCK